MAKVFISFVHEELEIANAVHGLLRYELGLGEDVFLSEDRLQVFAGDQWLKKIHEALASAQVVVLLFSKRASVRPWVNFEAGAAWLAGKPIIPCCYGNMRKDRLPHPYSTIQALDLGAEVDYLVDSVHHHLGLEGTPPSRAILKKLLTPQPTGNLYDLVDPKFHRTRLSAALETFIDIEYTQVVKRVRPPGAERAPEASSRPPNEDATP